ncbi:MAG TPA: GNAT family N-acetyltransferase [Vicinamibacterales bacterium]|nr:GNAT family N-acetyltransferase [Vicinamibacterales bacterium]
MTIRQSEYTSTVLTSAPDIARLDADVNRLMPDRDVALSPHFALASLDDNWTPSVAVVSRRGAVAGIVFGKERRVGRFSSGLIYADGRLGHLAVSSPDECEAVLLTAIRSWFALPRIRGVRLAMAPSSLEARAIDRVREALALDLTRATPAQHELHSTLPLPPSYETFLTCLGTQTRRNFRYYRRKFEAAGHRYVEHIAPQDLEEILRRLRTKSRIPFSIAKMRTAARTVLATSQPWAAALRHANGEFLSVTAGWLDGGRATMLLQQNNDLEFGDASLSVVLRGYLIETLIAQRVPELRFWSGSAPPLSRYAEPMAAISLHVDARTLGWRFVRSMIGATQPWLGRWFGDDLRWVALPRAPS